MSELLPPTRPHITTRTYRRPYKKSTKGCIQCKARRIKCDEIFPCSNCRKKYVDASCICKYTSLSKRDRDTSSEPNNPARSPLRGSLSVTPAGVSPSNLLELRLMHHFTKSTCSRYLRTGEPSMYHSLWNVEIPQIAFSSEIVLNALLGITALNLLSLTPNDRELSRAAWTHFDQAVVLQRDSLDQIDRQNAEPLFLAAVILAHFHWLASSTEEAPEPGRIEIQTYELCQGITKLARSPSLSEKYGSYTAVPLQMRQSSSLDSYFLKLAIQDMKKLLESVEKIDSNRTVNLAYQTAADEMIVIYKLIAEGCDDNAALEQRIVSMLHRLPDSFVQLLEANDPIALAILARNISCLELINDDSAWWVHGAGRAKVAPKAVRSICEGMPFDYLWTLDFPLKIVAKGLNINSAGP